MRNRVVKDDRHGSSLALFYFKVRRTYIYYIGVNATPRGRFVETSSIVDDVSYGKVRAKE